MGPWSGTSSASCTEGRQLGENHVLPPYYAKRRYEIIAGKLTGSRAGCPINHSALQSVLRNWTDAIQIIELLRDKYIARLDLQGKTLSCLDLYVLAIVCVSMPAYYLRRDPDPLVDGQVPAAVGAVYKLVAGMAKIVMHMVSYAEPVLLENDAPSGREMYDYAEKHNLFLSEDIEVCGGPEKMVVELLDITIHGRPPTAKEKQSTQKHFIPTNNVNSLLEYGIQCAILELAFSLFREKLVKATLDTLKDLEEDCETDRQIRSALLLSVETLPDGNLPGIDVVEFRIEVIVHALWRLGIAPPEEPTSIDDILESVKSTSQGSSLLEGLGASVREKLDAYLCRYFCIMYGATSFADQQQQQINRVLGRDPTSALELEHIALRVSEKAHDTLEQFGLCLTGAAR